MATFTSTIKLNMRWNGLEISGDAGTTHRIPDAYYEEFNGQFAGLIPGLTWVDTDELNPAPLGITGGTIDGNLTVTGALSAQTVGLVIYADRFSSLQAAIDAAPTSGAIIEIPRATYTITTPLVLKSNLHLRGQGMATKLLAASAISIARGTSASDVTIDNMYLDGGQSVAGGGSDADLIEAWASCDRWTITRCYLTRSARDAIGLRTGSGHLITGNTIVSCNEDGITLNNVTDARIIGNLISSVVGDAILLKSVRRTVVQGNTIVSPGTGMSGAGISIGADSATFNEYITVIGNSVLSAGGASIYCAFSSYCVFQGNTLKSGSLYGLWFDSSQDCVFNGNVIDGMASHGLRVVSASTRLAAQGNIIQNVGTANNGIEAPVGSGHRFIGNQFSGTMNRGINTSATSSVISGNHFSATVGTAIRVAGADNVVSNNVCLGAGESGAIWVSAARVNVLGNRVAGSAGHGILFASGGDNGVCTGNIVTDAASTKDAIRIDDCLNVVVSGNLGRGTAQEHGLHSTGTASGLVISGNQFSGNVTGDYSLVNTFQIDAVHGTAFPTTPTTNQKFFRTDRNLEYFWDGTRWLTTTLYRETLGIGDTTTPAGATSTPTIGRMSPWHTTYDMYLVDFHASLYIVTTNTTASFWTINLRKLNPSNTATTIATTTTSADAANTWVTKTVAVGAVLSPASFPSIESNAAKTGTPGNLYFGVAVSYRLVG